MRPRRTGGDMSNVPISRARPLSPHLQVYRFIPTMTMSIVHRITGAANYVGTLLVAWWLISAATSAHVFSIASSFFGSWIGMAILFCYTWSLIHHMLSGLRYLVWDTANLMEKKTTTMLAWATIAASVALTIIVWIIGLAVR